MLGLKKLKALLDEFRTALKLAETVGPSPTTWLYPTEELCDKSLSVAANLRSKAQPVTRSQANHHAGPVNLNRPHTNPEV